MSTPIRANWGDVTLAEYDALALVRLANAEAVLNQYWDDIHSESVFEESDTMPTRLTDKGREKLASWHDIARNSEDEPLMIRTAKEIIHSLGFLTVSRALQYARSEAPKN